MPDPTAIIAFGLWSSQRSIGFASRKYFRFSCVVIQSAVAADANAAVGNCVRICAAASAVSTTLNNRIARHECNSIGRQRNHVALPHLSAGRLKGLNGHLDNIGCPVNAARALY